MLSIMVCAGIFFIIPRFLQEADKMGGTALIRSCTTLQPLNRAFLTFTVCARSPKKALSHALETTAQINFNSMVGHEVRTVEH